MVMTRSIGSLLLLLSVIACDDFDGSKARQRAYDEAWNGPCHETSVLLATTVGSPAEHTCPNKRHKMRVTLASAPSNEEFGAIVFCECLK